MEVAEFLIQVLICLIISLVLLIWITPWWMCLLIAAVITWGGVLIVSCGDDWF